jgi:hypothetical protein
MTTLRWEPVPYSGHASFVADLHIDGGPYRYLVRRSRPHAREWIAKRDGEPFTRKTYKSVELAKLACEVDADSPSSVLNVKAMLARIELRKLEGHKIV